MIRCGSDLLFIGYYNFFDAENNKGLICPIGRVYDVSNRSDTKQKRFCHKKLDIIDKKSGLPYQFTAMCTIIEVNLVDEVFTVIMKPIRNCRWIISGSAIRSK
ncbi:MAG: thiamine-binding protein [Sulfurovum sp.]|nr:thiamine-binding protein [Sulfurovum sp.]